ncbi:MAG: class I SAM-dependent methyltransferase [Thermodesulfobacteriota bacterium]
MEQTAHLPDGYPPLIQYDRLPHNPILQDMIRFNSQFLLDNRSALEYYSKRWVPDPLHNWSRRWEYPFCYAKLQTFLAATDRKHYGILDAGSGNTFFPFFVASAHRNIVVDCVDIDPSVIDFGRKLQAQGNSAVNYCHGDLRRLDHSDRSLDAIYSISVLEHISSRLQIVSEFARVLKPGGRLVITLDVSLNGTGEIPVTETSSLLRSLSTDFLPDQDYSLAVRTIREGAILTSDHARTIDATLVPWERWGFWTSVRNFFRSGRFHANLVLTVFCTAWTKR